MNPMKLITMGHYNLKLQKNTFINKYNYTSFVTMDSLCNQMNMLSVNSKLVNDIDVIISEIKRYNHYNLDIYELCVSCGHSLTWDIEYTLTQRDVNWLSGAGKNYFFTRLNEHITIDTQEKYNCVNDIYSKLMDLFFLQIAD